MKKWEWDKLASHGYNVVASFESTLINLGIIEDYSDIEDTERFDEKWSIRIPKVEEYYDQEEEKESCKEVFKVSEFSDVKRPSRGLNITDEES